MSEVAARSELSSYGLDRVEELPEGGWGAGRAVDDMFMVELPTLEEIVTYVRSLPAEISERWRTNPPRKARGHR